MDKIPNGFPRTRAAVLLGAVLLVGLVAYSGAPAIERASAEVSAAPVAPAPHQDPSLAGLRVSPDAEPGGEIDTF
jgi:hypothetical protein